MATITAAQQTEIVKICAGLFNAAPGAAYLTEFATLVAGGTTTQQLANALAANAVFTTSIMGGKVTAEAQTQQLMINSGLPYAAPPTGGTAAGDAQIWIAAQIAANRSFGDIVYDAVTALSDAAWVTANPLYADVATTLSNKAAVSEYYSATLATSSTTLTALQAVVSSVTATTPVATTTELQAALEVGGASTGQTFTLTAGADTLDPNNATAANKTTSGDDTFRAPTDGFLTSADFINAGAGTDTLTASITAASQTIAPSLTSVENITLTITAADTKTTTFDATDVTGATTVTIKDASSVSSDDYTTPDELITVSNLVVGTTLGIVGGSGTVTGSTASAISATFASAAAADTQKVAISSKGTVGLLTLATAETVEITATGTGTTGANTIEQLAATAVKTLNIKGAGDLTIGASDLSATITVNASTATGEIAFTGETAATSTTFTGGSGNTTVTTATTGTVAITTGAGDDTVDVSGGNSTGTISVGEGANEVKVGASSNVTTADTITAGSGTADTITVSDTAINATTKTNLAKGISGFEVVKTTATAEVAIDFNALSTWNTVIVAGASGATAAVAATAGTASIAATIENTDALVVAAARVGQAGGVASGNTAGVETSEVGGNGITLTPKLDAGANAATLKFIGNADVTGGAGGASAGSGGGSDVAGAGGVGLSASTIETLNIEVAGTNATGVAADTVTIAGGAGGAATDSGDVAGAAGSTVVVGANATINITDSLYGADAAVYNNLNLGTVIGTNVIIDASTFHGVLTVTAADGNVQITGGSGKDVLTGGDGIDTIVGGAGADIITGGAGADVLTGGTGRDSFTIVTEGHSGATTYDTIADFGKVTIATSTTETAAMSSVSAFQATATAKGGAAADMLDVEGTATLAVAATGTDVSAGVTGGGTISGAITAKGIVTVTGAQSANVDTLAEWVAVTKIMTAAGNAAAFEFGGNTYVFTEGAGTDDLVQLTGVTGVTGITLLGSSVAAAVGDIFVL